MPIIVQATGASATTLDLTAIFLNAAEDPADFMAFEYIGDSYRVDDSLGGGVEHGYASGRSRSWSTDDDVTAVPLTLVYLTEDQITWLRGHRGQTVCFRDAYGEKVYGAYHAVPLQRSTMPPGHPATVHQTTLQIESVYHSEEV